ncbi:transposase [Nonomuraea phyllanthi]|nr:transposase [Nonomuraea phyllanthi]
MRNEAWPAAQPTAWRDQIAVVAIDMSTSEARAVRTALPHPHLAVDHFHAIQAANKVIDLLRRRACYGRRGRAGDPEYGMRRTLLRNWEEIPETRANAMWGSSWPPEAMASRCWPAGWPTNNCAPSIHTSA